MHKSAGKSNFEKKRFAIKNETRISCGNHARQHAFWKILRIIYLINPFQCTEAFYFVPFLYWHHDDVNKIYHICAICRYKWIWFSLPCSCKKKLANQLRLISRRIHEDMHACNYLFLYTRIHTYTYSQRRARQLANNWIYV